MRSSTLTVRVESVFTVRLSKECKLPVSIAAILELLFSPGVAPGEPTGSTQFLHPMHLHIAEHAILAWILARKKKAVSTMIKFASMHYTRIRVAYSQSER